jgi:hypothetical protein
MVSESDHLIKEIKHYQFVIRLVLILIIVGFILLRNVDIVLSAVDLRYFQAVANEASITIEWGTATELDHAGFFVLRGTALNGDYQRISSFIYAQGDSLTGADYEYDDQNVQSGHSYWYKLESIDTSQRSNYSDPVSVGFKLPTATSTLTRTPTLTPTLTQSATVRPDSTVIPTNTPAPTNTLSPTIMQANNDQQTEIMTDSLVTGTESVEFELTSTATVVERAVVERTLIPFPTITIQFPIKRILATQQLIYGGQLINQSDKEPEEVQFGRYILYFILFGIWAILGFWIFRITRATK